MNCDPSSLMQSARCLECIPPGMQSGVRSYLLCQWANKPSVPTCTDPYVTDWLNRMVLGGVAPGDMPTPDQQQAVCEFCHDLEDAGIDTKMVSVNVVVNVGTANRIDTMRYPLITPALFPVWVNNGFLAADLNDDGVVGDGLGKYFDTLISPVAHLTDSTGGLSVYVVDFQTGIGAEAEMGSFDSVPNTTINLSTWDILAGAGHSACWVTAGNFFGGAQTPDFYSVNRTTAQFFQGYEISVALGVQFLFTDFTNNAGQVLPAQNILASAVNNDGLDDFWSSKRISFFAIHEGLNGFEALDLFNAVQTLRIKLGGGYIP